MTADLTVRFHDARRPDEPLEWGTFQAADGDNPLWSWPVVHALVRAYGDPVVAGTLHDGEQVVGVVVGRLRGLHRGAPWVTLADLTCPGSGALSGIRLLGGTPGVDLDRDDIARYGAAVEAIEVALRTAYGRRVVAVAHRQIYPELLPVVERGMCVVRTGLPSAMLRRRFDSWEQYLGTLGRSRRSSIRRVLRQFDGDARVGLEVLHGLPEGDLADARTLMRSTATRHRATARRWPPAGHWPDPIVDALLRAPGSRVLRYRFTDGRPLAFGVLYDHQRVPVHGHWGALDVRADGAPSGLWVDQMARTVRHSIEAGAHGAVGGKGLADLKAEFGFDVVPQWTVVRRLGPVQRPVPTS